MSSKGIVQKEKKMERFEKNEKNEKSGKTFLKRSIPSHVLKHKQEKEKRMQTTKMLKTHSENQNQKVIQF
jgi:hypothetical protein